MAKLTWVRNIDGGRLILVLFIVGFGWQAYRTLANHFSPLTLALSVAVEAWMILALVGPTLEHL